MTTKTLMTADEFLTHPCDAPSELVCGEVIEMSPAGFRHGLVVLSIGMILRIWARQNSAGYVAVSESGVRTQSDPDSIRCPDCMFIRAERIPDGFNNRGFLSIPPDLAVEVLFPNDRWSEVIAKVGEYLASGVKEVWVADSDLRQVQVFRSDGPPSIYKADDELTSERVLPGFRCEVSELFVEK